MRRSTRVRETRRRCHSQAQSQRSSNACTRMKRERHSAPEAVRIVPGAWLNEAVLEELHLVGNRQHDFGERSEPVDQDREQVGVDKPGAVVVDDA